jgi:ATP-dependent helicase/nuclease subunit A
LQKGDVVSPVQSNQQRACDPARSVMVSACAGSGKTWLLVARLVRILLAGAKPHEFLALTFTRKAAQEMRERLYGLLEEFARCDDAALIAALVERGLDDAEARAAIPQARALYETVLASPQAIVIDTFHGWFGKLLGAAPVSIGIQPGFSLREDSKRLQEECLADWWSQVPKELKPHYESLLQQLGAHETLQFLTGSYSAFKQRGAWTFFEARCFQQGTTPIQQLEQMLTQFRAPNAVLQMWNAPITLTNLELLARCFANSTQTEKNYCAVIESAIDAKKAGLDITQQDALIAALEAIFLTKEKTPRSANAKVSTDLKKWLSKADQGISESGYLACKEAWADAFLANVQRDREAVALQLNTAWFAMSAAMLAHVQASKEAMRVRDFDDLEIGVSQLMADSSHAAYLQARLDSRYQHILIDEFQDTNPLQWQILRSWLEGYGADTNKPSIFIVGDPKQSIYRFRRADPRLFDTAKDFLQSELGADFIELDVTRRNAPAINNAVNRTFTSDLLPESYPYTLQTTAWTAPNSLDAAANIANQGEAYLLPLIAPEEHEASERSGNAFAGPLPDASETGSVMQRYREGQRIAQIIGEVIQTRRVLELVDGQKRWRDPRPSDFLLLVKRRQYLPQFERALREAGLAFESSRLGGLLNTLEIDDLIALLTILVTPRHDLPLAQVLRSPLFGASEDQMQSLAISLASDGYRSWWDALQASSDPALLKAGRYLEHWRVLGEHLPVHDLLDQIYAEHDVRMRYAMASDDLLRPQVLANLDAFLELALNHDGGRYPSLGRFIAEIKAMRQGDDDETPDEGEMDLESEAAESIELGDDNLLSDADRNKRVRMMTVHGAKGLEAPFVVLLDTNHTTGMNQHRGILLDWPPNETAPIHLSVFTKDTITNPRTQIQEEEQRIASNENWNALYVAMTRAKQGLWISGVATSSAKEKGLDLNSWYYRIQSAELPDFAIPEEVATTPKDQKSTVQSQSNTSLPFSIDDFALEWDVAKSSHALQLANIESGVVNGTAPVDQVDDDLDPRILEDGVHFHALLECCTLQSGSTISDLPSLAHTMNWFGIDEARATLALSRAKTVLQTDTLKPYLLDGGWIQAWNEIDVLMTADENESMPDEQNKKTIHTRFDRLVEFADRLVILDYKLSLPKEGDRKSTLYQKQLQQYASGLQRIRHDKPIEAYLVSAAGGLQRLV